MMRVARLRQRFRSPPLEQALDPRPLGAHSIQVELGGTRTRDHDEIDSSGDQTRPGPETLTTQALDAVSSHGVADAPADDEAEPRRAAIPLGSHEEREMRRPDPSRGPAGLRTHEFCVLAEPAVGAEGHGIGWITRPRRKAYFL
jgi:hypothetical protein